MNKTHPRVWLHRAGQLLRGRALPAAGLAAAVCVSLFAVSENIKILYIADGAEVSTALALRSESEEEILARLGITLAEHDTLDSYHASPMYSRVIISRGISATLVVDGVEMTSRFTEGTVADLLAEHGVTLQQGDYLSQPADAPLGDGDVITVSHLEKKVTQQTVTVPYETVQKKSSLLAAGKSRVVTEGTDGRAVETYEELWDGDTLVSRTLVSTKITKEPEAALEVVGSPGTAISRLDWTEEFPLDENGIPIDYKVHRTDLKATGYSGKAGTYGSGGGYCYYGTVAANPRNYPYGTKLYIRSADGKFVYGYALVTDTGEFIHTTSNSFDLFYETYRESALNGLRTVEVYVLEWGNGSMYGWS